MQAFLAQSEAAFRQHPVWRGCQPEVLDQAVEVCVWGGGGLQIWPRAHQASWQQ